MSLDYLRLRPQIEAMGETAAKYALELRERIPQALQHLHESAEVDSVELDIRINKAGERWHGARPTSELMSAIFAPPEIPDHFAVIGADGSQIFPDRHALALYYMINVASITIIHKSGRTPWIQSHPRLFYHEEELYDSYEGLIQNDYISMQRDVWELEELADRALDIDEAPLLTLLDNGLLLYSRLQDGGLQKKIDALHKMYLQQLSRLKSANASLAGYIDRPRSAQVLRLVHLSRLPVDEVDEESAKLHPYRGLADRMLFSQLLPSGHRSARFFGTSPQYKTFEKFGHPIEFFYLNTGYQNIIARVEIPGWVAEDEKMLSLVHAGLLQECGSTGIPYVLVRAHELAVVGRAERDALEQMLRSIWLRNNLDPAISQKARTKSWTG